MPNFYKTNFNLKQHHNWNLEYLDSIMPWERMIYVELLKQYLKNEQEQARDKAAEIRAAMRAAQRR